MNNNNNIVDNSVLDFLVCTIALNMIPGLILLELLF